jgi:hypothetical protein
MKKVVITLIIVLFLMVIIFLVMPFLMGTIIDQGRPSYFLSIITGIFTLSGMWQLFRGKIKPGIGLLLLAVVMFLFTQHMIYIY